MWSNLRDAVENYTKCLFVNVDNVTSKQICVMRKAFRDLDAHVVMGKNVSNAQHANTILDPHAQVPQRPHC